MARRGGKTNRDIETYAHAGKERANNPPVGLVTPETDKDVGRKTYAHDPHLDPQLVWTGKAEHTSFEVPTVSLHVHERIDPRTVIEAVRKRNGTESQPSLFAAPEENPPIRQAIEFYKHRHNWTNRLIAGDNLLVMNSLIEKEGLGGQVQTVYLDPPYGIHYRSNFQPFVNQREVTDGKDEDLTGEPEQIRAFRDTWELGIHSYLAYLRDRLLLARELLHDSGSCFVQVGDENVHRVSVVMDEIFGAENRMATISYATTGASSTSTLPEVADYLLWYAKDTGVIVAHARTDATGEDATTGVELIEAVNDDSASVTADAAYDTVGCYDAAGARGAPVVVPPTTTARVSRRRPRSSARDHTINTVKSLGRRRWKQTSRDHQHARVENAFFRYQSIIGDGLRARTPGGRTVDAQLAGNRLNAMTDMGRPASYAVGR